MQSFMKLRFSFELRSKQILLFCNSDIRRAVVLPQPVEYQNGHCLAEVEKGHRFTLLLMGYQLIHSSRYIYQAVKSRKYPIDRKLLHGSKYKG